MKKKVVLIIMDGWGIAPPDKFNAIANANTPNFDRLVRDYPNTSLKSDGLSVGLPEGQFGTSEVNHLTIGSGRVIFQDLPRINKAIENGSFFENQALLKTIEHVKQQKSKLNLMGILSDGGVHSHIKHLFAILQMLENEKFAQPVYLHLFSDGRDVAPRSVEKYFEELENFIARFENIKVKIATLQGRFYLDRDRDWEKTEKAFKLIAEGEGNPVSNWQAAVNLEYNKNNNDEYFPQYLIDENGLIKDNDGLIIFHFRTDRIFQIIRRILDQRFENFEMTSFISPSEEFVELNVAFPRIHVNDTLSETIANAGLKQLHIAETEKFPHVTYFFNGEKEKEMAQEEWKKFESNRFIKPMYNFEPSMRNFDISKSIIEAIESDEYNFIIVNLSSPDMVGHTGNYNAAVVSAESVDFCIGKIYEAVKPKLKDYAVLITADHGNSDIMWDYENNQPHTQHTLSKVPFIMVSDIECKLDQRESLEDIAPTVLDLMGIDKPQAMTGTSLVVRE